MGFQVIDHPETADALLDLCGQALRPGAPVTIQDGRQATQGAGEEGVPGNVETELAGVVAGPEGLEDQPAFPGPGPAARACEGVGCGSPRTGEAIRARCLMLLFGLGDGEDDVEGVMEIGIQPLAAAEPVQAERQVEREGQRVELPLAFPHPRPLSRLVVIPAVSVRSPVEGVGVGIDQDHSPVTPEQAGGHPSQFWVARGETKQRGQLQTGIPQPHGGDVAGDHPGLLAVLAQIDRGGGDVGQ